MVAYYKAKVKKEGRYLIKRTKKVKEIKTNIIHYDRETYRKKVEDMETREPYILGFVEPDGMPRYFAGETCVDDFIRYLASKNEKYILNAYNGSSFDRYNLFRSIIKLGKKPEKFVFNNGSLIILETKTGPQFTCFDLCKHVGV